MSRIILVTGANGFVGRHVCAWLAEAGWTVRGAVRSGHGIQLPDLTDDSPEARTRWEEALSGADAVLHAAARVHVMRDYSANPLGAFRAVNVAGTERLARAAAAAGVRRLVYLSSIKVNGEATTERPYAASDTPAPEDAYGLSKWEAEQALSRIARETGMEVVVVRPPLVYGPGVGANFRRLMGLAAKGWPLPLGSLDNRRSLVFVGNLCSLILAALEHPAAAGRTFLASDGEDLSTAELFRRLARAQGAPSRLWPCPLGLLRLAGLLTGRSAEIARLAGSLCVDSSTARTELGWQPPFTVDEGLARTVAGCLDQGPHK